MTRWSMRTRLLASFATVAITGAIAFMISMRVMVPRLFDQRAQAGYGMGNQGMMTQHEVVVSAVNTAMLVALAASLACSALIALVLSNRALRGLDHLRAGTRRLAAGQYDTPVERPGVPELATLADDINQLAATLAATEQHRAALIGDVAHEMRTPLTTIAGYLEGFDDGLFTAPEMAAAVSTEVTRLHHLAQDFASVSRAEEGQLPLDLAEVDFGDIVRTACTRLGPRFTAAGVELVVDTPERLPVVVDGERMIQVLTNLIANALAYTPGGGRVTLTARTGPDGIVADVTDTGRGLRPDDLERVFERFYRADPHDHSGGTGVGLTVSRAIARAHGGDLIARSGGLDQGSTFELTVPARLPH